MIYNKEKKIHLFHKAKLNHPSSKRYKRGMRFSNLNCTMKIGNHTIKVVLTPYMFMNYTLITAW